MDASMIKVISFLEQERQKVIDEIEKSPIMPPEEKFKYESALAYAMSIIRQYS